MIEKFFEAVSKTGNKYEFLNGVIKEILTPHYHRIQRWVTSQVSVKPTDTTALAFAKRNDFLAQNPDRINAIANILADEQSKKTYLGMVKFRQTCQKKDFPFSCYVKKQYFIEEFNFDKNEVFIDCGAYTGDTIDEFLKHCPEYKQIVAFEPDAKLFNKLSKKHSNNSKITLVNAGSYDKNGEIFFEIQPNRLTGRTIDAQNADDEEMKQKNLTSIQVKTIDSLNLEKVSFVKMDIEGAELNALKGAEKTLLKDKPKLAICLYHNNEDMIQIAEYIHSLIPDYKIYIRQHKLYPSAAETVLYAIMP